MHKFNSSMNNKEISKILFALGKKEKAIKAIYIYGSRVKNTYNQDSDLDIAIEVYKLPGDLNTDATFIGEVNRWHDHLKPLIAYKLDIQQLNFSDNESIITKAIEKEGVKAYSRSVLNT